MQKGNNTHDNLSSLVIDYLKNKILLGEYKEGDRILETDVAEELRISRAPVREGIKELINQGLVKSVPRKGNFVVRLTLEDIKEIFDIRIMLENRIIELVINDDKLCQDDFEKLATIVDEMVEIAKGDLDNIQKILKINQKDIEFHRFLWDKSESRRRKKILEDLHLQLSLAMLFDIKITNNLVEMAKDHYDIIRYLKLKDITNSKKTLKRHITSVTKYMH